MITTTQTTPDNPDGLMDEALLEKKEGVNEDDDVRVYWVEYRFPGQDEIIHRSVDVKVKRMPVAAIAEAGSIL